MVLERIGVQQLCTGTIAQNQAVGGSTVVVGRREALVMEPSRTAGGNDNRFGPGHQNFLGLHVAEHRTGALAVLILNEFNGGGEVHHGNAPVQHFIAERPHDFRAGVVLGGMHTLPGGTAAMGGDHGAVGSLVEFHAQLTEPADGLGGLGDQFIEQILLGRKVAAAEGIQKVLGRAVVGLVGGLDAALGHHGVGVTHAQLGDHHDVGAAVVGLDGCRSAGAAAADDQHIHVIVGVLQIDGQITDAGMGLQQCSQLHRHLVAFVGAHLQVGELLLTVVGMIGGQQLFLLLGRHSSGVQLDVLRPGRLHLADRLLHDFILIHGKLPPYFSISRLLYSSLISLRGFCMRSSMSFSYLPSAISRIRSSR